MSDIPIAPQMGMGDGVPVAPPVPIPETAQAPEEEVFPAENLEASDKNQGDSVVRVESNVVQEPAEGLSFEDHFPPLNLTRDDEESLSGWFRRDLMKCLRNVRMICH